MTTKARLGNYEVSEVLDQISDLLEVQKANPHRARAYRMAAETVRTLDRPIDDVVEEGVAALERLPGIGERIAATIVEMTSTGRAGTLDRLREEMPPERLIATVPGVGPRLARQIVESLPIESLEDLEVAAHDGSLRRIEGFGARRVELIQETLAGMLSRKARRRTGQIKAEVPRPQEPSVAMLLEVDAEYRQRADAGELHTIAPRRFNPQGVAWLPIMDAERGDWHFTALFSNTARAHELGMTGDWVVIFYEFGHEGQSTVVTQRTGSMKGLRVVRGREGECQQHYAGHERDAELAATG